ncbi:MAG: BadF/BadG/BcrA/BcrD ATPase family protein [Candidatus Promineifilaceae bacterium]
MAAYYLGVDTGATKSVALLAGEDGRILGRGLGGPGNWEAVGWSGTRAVLEAIIAQALAGARLSRRDISGAGFGLAGYDWPEDRAPHEALLRELGFHEPWALVNDAALGLAAGADQGWGVVVSAGTSCNAYGRNADGAIGRLSGNSRLGEYAGAGELVQYGLQAVSRAWSLRGPRTALTAVFLQAAGAADATDLLAGVSRGRYTLHAGLAPLIFRAAASGDGVAQEAVDWAGRGLGDLALGVVRQVRLQDENFPVVLAGSFFNGSPRLGEQVIEMVRTEAPGAFLARLEMPPVTGALLLAMEAAGPLTGAARTAVLAQLRAQFGPEGAYFNGA